ncbi:response regulator [Candidatus Omnitrophota bacterium]
MCKAKKILFIEDSPTIIALIKMRLEASGFIFLSAIDGLSGIELAKKEMPDLILLDVKMPGIDGFETCKRLKNDKDTEAIPVLFLTAEAQEDDRAEGRRSGCNGYITKPFMGQELVEEIKEWLDRDG